jgi:hypothetical protein
VNSRREVLYLICQPDHFAAWAAGKGGSIAMFEELRESLTDLRQRLDSIGEHL